MQKNGVYLSKAFRGASFIMYNYAFVRVKKSYLNELFISLCISGFGLVGSI
jgi:hypothetical protein